MTTETKQVTVNDVIAEVRKLAEEMPDFVYTPDIDAVKGKGSANGCSYIVGGCSNYPDCRGCIMGQALRRLGLSVPDNRDDLNVCKLLRHLFIIEGHTYSTERWLMTVQSKQDLGRTWSECVQGADHLYPLS